MSSIDCFTPRSNPRSRLEPNNPVLTSSMEHHQTTSTPASGATKKHTRSRGRSKKQAPPDPYDASTYGIIPFLMFRGRPWTSTRDLGEAMAGKHVMVFGKVWSVRPLGRARAVVVLFNSLTSCTVRCVVAAGSHDGRVTTRTVRFAATLSRETVIDVEGVVSLPESGKILATTQQVEIQVEKLHSIELGRATTKPQGGKCQRSRTTPTPVKLEETVVETS